MRVSAKRSRVVKAMIDLCLREQAGPVPLVAIAARQHISLSYLEQLFARLRAAGLVCSSRGPGGGYQLGREPAAISVAAIVDAVDIAARPGPADTACARATHELCLQLDRVMRAHMEGISLADLADVQRADEAVAQGRPSRKKVAPRPQARVPGLGLPNSVFELARVMGMTGPRHSDR